MIKFKNPVLMCITNKHQFLLVIHRVPVAINYSKSLRIHHNLVVRLPYLQYTRQVPSVVMVEMISSVVSKLEELQEDSL